jgi:glycosyltransferase involved in cell wall biosynthesis
MFQKKQIRIGIDARFYGPKQKGLGRYVQKLVENLEKVTLCHSEQSKESSSFSTGSFGRPRRPQDDKFKYEFVIFLRKENWHEYQPTNSNFKKVLADYQWYGLKEQILMPLKIWQAKLDLIHFPHFNVPIFCFSPLVITIHDLILKKFPTRRASTLGPIRYWLKNLAYCLVIYSAVKRARKIIAVSNYTKEDILKYFKIKPEKVKVVYEGAPEKKIKNQKHISKIKNTYQKSKILKKYNITKQYLLYVGNAYPHKNLERLILAFKKLNKDYQGDLQLVLVGELDYFYQRLQKQFSGLKEVIFTDFVSDQELTALYQNASLYVFPSLCEGFGLPPLEAMAYQLPVIASETSCLPEVLGPAAIYFNPEDIEDMAKKIKQVLEDRALQEKLISEGKKRIEKYSWTKMAQEILEVYRWILR